MSSATNSYDIAWLQPISGGMQWYELVGGFMIFYCASVLYRGGTKDMVWKILLVNAASGIIGTLFETAFIAGRAIGNTNTNLAYLIAFNEINWILHESTVVLYSYWKTMIVVDGNRIGSRVKNIFNAIMILIFAVFAALRINIGRLRFGHNTLGDQDISDAHSYAFLAWGAADLIIIGLLVWNVIDYVKTSGANTTAIVKAILTSSIPRITIIFLNTIAIVVVGQIHSTDAHLGAFNQFLWLVKGTYPTIMLVDVLMTKEALIQVKNTQVQSSHHSSTHKNHSDSKQSGEEKV